MSLRNYNTLLELIETYAQDIRWESEYNDGFDDGSGELYEKIKSLLAESLKEDD